MRLLPLSKGWGLTGTGDCAIDELLSGGRLRIGQETGLTPSVLLRSALLAKEKLKPGMEVRLDANQRVALSHRRRKRIERALETVAELPWNAVGGRTRRCRRFAIHRDAFLHRALFKRFEHNVPKVFFFTVRPVAARRCSARPRVQFASEIRSETGDTRSFPACQGAEILNMWVGSRAQVRDLLRNAGEGARLAGLSVY